MEGHPLIGVRPTTPCIEWQGSRTSAGYGQLKRNGRVMYAHRLAYEGAHGPIPAGMCVCHACDNPACVNPEHLWIGTKGDNLRDMCAKGRHTKAGAAGEKNRNAKLTAEAVVEIRRMRAAGATYRAIAARFGITRVTASLVARGRAWKHVE